MYKDLEPATLAANDPARALAKETSREAYWMPFTANRQFKREPRLLAKASGTAIPTPFKSYKS